MDGEVLTRNNLRMSHRVLELPPQNKNVYIHSALQEMRCSSGTNRLLCRHSRTAPRSRRGSCSLGSSCSRRQSNFRRNDAQDAAGDGHDDIMTTGDNVNTAACHP
mgnify:CR=1 FL=1